MPLDLLQPLPRLTADLPGIGGRLKVQFEDFVVEEIPAYAPSGSGDFLYLWIEKRDMGAEFFARQVAQRLRIPVGDVGTAGLKDRRAVTRQWVSVPAKAEDSLGQLEGDGLKVLEVSRHTNKLRPGHLRGNRFTIRVAGVEAAAASRLPDVLERVRTHGLLNYYGAQRFGRGGETLGLGMQLLRGERTPRTSPFLRKLALSAVQSALFNLYLAHRFTDGFVRRVLAGDVMAKWPFGGMFTATDVDVEQARLDRREIVPAGPMFGRKMFPTAGIAAEREARLLQEAELTPASFAGFGKLLQGTRRHALVYVDDLEGHLEGGDALLTFTLPAGSYATVLLDEVTKSTPAEADELGDEDTADDS